MPFGPAVEQPCSWARDDHSDFMGLSQLHYDISAMPLENLAQLPYLQLDFAPELGWVGAQVFDFTYVGEEERGTGSI
jgi:hypothetical protein